MGYEKVVQYLNYTFYCFQQFWICQTCSIPTCSNYERNLLWLQVGSSHW